VPTTTAIAALRRAHGPPMRLAAFEAGGVMLVDDTYNANPGSVEAAFRTLAAAPIEGRRVVVLGDMLELGPLASELHEKCGELVSLLPELLLVAAGPHADDVARGALAKGADPARVVTCADAASAARIVPPLLEPGDTVLVKGSRGMAMEKVVEAIRARFSKRPAAESAAARRAATKSLAGAGRAAG